MRQHRTVILPSFATIFLCSLLLTASFVVFGGVVRVLSMEKNLYAVEAFLPESLEAMKRMSGRLSILSKERIAEELNKMLLTVRPSMGFRLMDETGLLEHVLPQLSALKGEKGKRWRSKATSTHFHPIRIYIMYIVFTS